MDSAYKREGRSSRQDWSLLPTAALALAASVGCSAAQSASGDESVTVIQPNDFARLQNTTLSIRKAQRQCNDERHVEMNVGFDEAV